MKRTLKMFLVVIEFIALLLMQVFVSSAEENEKVVTIEQVIGVVSEINSEYGACFEIAFGTEDAVLDNIRKENYTICELKNSLIDAWKEYVSNESKNLNAIPVQKEKKFRITNSKNKFSITPYSMTESIEQKCPIEYNSWIFLRSTVFSPSGALNSFTYRSVKLCGIGYYNSSSIKVVPKGASYSISSDKKRCTVTAKGVPTTKEGIALTVIKTYKTTFYAG